MTVADTMGSSTTGGTTGSGTTGGGTTGSSTTGSSTTGSGGCEISECIEIYSWEYGWNPPSCGNLWWLCEFSAPCERVYLSLSDPPVVETVDAAICVLTAMRDGTPGRFELDLSGNLVDVVNVGDGTGMIQWSHTYGDLLCSVFSQRLELQPASYFSDCLADPTPVGLAACLGTTYDCEFDVITPPWATGACTGEVPALCSWGG